MNVSLNVWRVTYTTVFSSSSTQGGPFSSTTAGREKFVLTAGRCLEEVERVLEGGLGCQDRLIEITRAEWLGVGEAKVDV